MKQPMTVSGVTKLSLKQWPDYTKEEHILLHSDSLLTVCEPSAELKAAYLKKIGKTEEDFKPKEEPVLLQEDDVSLLDDDNDYEPRYVEERDEY